MYFDWQVEDATRGVEWAAVPGAECMLLSSAGVFLRTAKSLTNFYGVAIIEDVQPGYYQVGAQIEPTVYRELATLPLCLRHELSLNRPSVFSNSLH